MYGLFFPSSLINQFHPAHLTNWSAIPPNWQAKLLISSKTSVFDWAHQFTFLADNLSIQMSNQVIVNPHQPFKIWWPVFLRGWPTGPGTDFTSLQHKKTKGSFALLLVNFKSGSSEIILQRIGWDQPQNLTWWSPPLKSKAHHHIDNVYEKPTLKARGAQKNR